MTPGLIASAFLYTVFVWWFSTGVILWLDRRPRAARPWIISGASLVAAAAVGGLVVTARDSTPLGAVLAFTCALGLWGWHELSFLMGLITGPRDQPCPEVVSPGRRFKLAASTLIFHEVALAATAVTLVILTWRAPNAFGAVTFLVLFAARLSAKLNLFFGVPNFSAEFFPDRLAYLTSYLRRAPASPFFPASVGAGLLMAGALGWQAMRPGAAPFVAVGFSLTFVLAALALLEHAFMVMPLPDTALWRWAVPAAPPRSPRPVDV